MLHGDHLGNYQEQGRLQCSTAHFKGLHQMNSYSELVNFHTSNPLPPFSPSLTSLLLMPSGILTVLMNITPPTHHQTQTRSYSMMRSPWCALAAVLLKHKEKRAAVKDKSACQTFALCLLLLTGWNWTNKVFWSWRCTIFPDNLWNSSGCSHSTNASH